MELTERNVAMAPCNVGCVGTVSPPGNGPHADTTCSGGTTASTPICGQHTRMLQISGLTLTGDSDERRRVPDHYTDVAVWGTADVGRMVMDAELRALGEQALETFPADDKEAIDWMITKLLDDKALFNTHVVPLVTEAVKGIIRYLQGQQRRSIRLQVPGRDESTPPEPLSLNRPSQIAQQPHTRETPPREARIRGQKTSSEYNWLNYPVEGKPLGEHTRQTLLKCAGNQIKAGHTQIVNGYFFTSVAERLKNDKIKVKEVLSHDALAKLHEEAEGRVA